MGLEVQRWVSKSSLGLQIQPGTTSLAWDYKTGARKEDKHPTSNTAPTRSVIKEGLDPGSLGAVQDRAQLSAHVILAWVYKSSVGLEV